jgi:energy-coupling factor transport system ATP-binding protein
MLNLEQVSFRYLGAQRSVLRDVTLRVPAGQICGLVGPAGAGKSTLCMLCAGFMPQFYHGRVSGRATVDGQDAIALPVADLVRHVGLVGSSTFAQISGARFSVFEEIAFGLENLGLPRGEIIERVEWAADLLGIAGLRDRSPYALSGGQQQRVVIAAALALRPPVLVLDEPTLQLDPPTTLQLAEVLRGLARQGTTILFAEHRLEWTAELAERVLVLDAGELIADGAPEAILAGPLLRERGVGWPRPARIAERLRGQGRWPAGRPLPVTLADLAAGYKGQGEGRRTEDGGWRTEDEVQPSTLNAQFGSEFVGLRDVCYRYPNGPEALRGVSLALGGGERVALLGRNGAGKSTLVRHLNGLLRPASGSATVGGVETRKLSVARAARQVGIVFQDVRNQLFARTVRDELRFGPRNLGYSPAQIEALVDQALAWLGLADVADEHPYDLPLSGRRLVAIAAVLAMDTRLLVLDEPTAGLDTSATERLVALAHDLAAQGRSVLVVSHDLDFCYEALERVVLVRDGLIALDSRWDALDSHARALLDQTVGLPTELRLGEPAQ